jgi:DNA-binding winged helix-turn-helix (wHTH) protein/Tfp pilus assembly protein PilF
MVPALKMPDRLVRFGVFEFHLDSGELKKHGHTLRLQEQPRKLLHALLVQPGALVSRQELAETIWDQGTFVDFEHGLNAAVARLRQLLRDSAENPRYIETVSRKGYRFVAPLESASEPGFFLSTEMAQAPPAKSHTFSLSKGRLLAAVAAGLMLAFASIFFAGWQTKRSGEWHAADQEYRTGMELLRRRTLPEVRRAADEFRRVIAAQPKSAPAWAGLAEASAFLQPEDATTCVELAERAVQLDPSCAECLATLGFIRFTRQWNWTASGQLLQRAAAALPGDSQVQYWYAQWHVANGHTREALEVIDRSLKRYPQGLNLLVLRAGSLYFARDFDAAVHAADKAIAVNLPGAWHWRAKALFMLRRYPDAVRSLWFDLGTWSSLSADTISQRAANATRRFYQDGLEGPINDLIFMTAGSDAATMQAESRARWFMLLGRHEAALDSLETAVRARLFDLIYLPVDPIYDPLRDHARFHGVLQKVKPQATS